MENDALLFKDLRYMEESFSVQKYVERPVSVVK